MGGINANEAVTALPLTERWTNSVSATDTIAATLFNLP